MKINLNDLQSVRFEVFTMITMKFIIFSDVIVWSGRNLQIQKLSLNNITSQLASNVYG